MALRNQVHSWLQTAQPNYIGSRPGASTFAKGSRGWQYHEQESDTTIYHKFINSNWLDIKRGPEYEEVGFVDGKFRLEYMSKTSKHRDPDEVNRLLNRGWHVLTLEVDREGPNETTYYVLGHVEPDAF